MIKIFEQLFFRGVTIVIKNIEDASVPRIINKWVKAVYTAIKV